MGIGPPGCPERKGTQAAHRQSPCLMASTTRTRSRTTGAPVVDPGLDLHAAPEDRPGRPVRPATIVADLEPGPLNGFGQSNTVAYDDIAPSSTLHTCPDSTSPDMKLPRGRNETDSWLRSFSRYPDGQSIEISSSATPGQRPTERLQAAMVQTWYGLQPRESLSGRCTAGTMRPDSCRCRLRSTINGARSRQPASWSNVMPICPVCGAPGVPCLQCESESTIASWVEPLPPSIPSQHVADPGCAACGYAGELTSDGRGKRCPVCGVVVPRQRAGAAFRVTGTVDCCGCGRRIVLAADDAGKTLICPGCAYFLGTPVLASSTRRRGLAVAVTGPSKMHEARKG